MAAQRDLWRQQRLVNQGDSCSFVIFFFFLVWNFLGDSSTSIHSFFCSNLLFLVFRINPAPHWAVTVFANTHQCQGNTSTREEIGVCVFIAPTSSWGSPSLCKTSQNLLSFGDWSSWKALASKTLRRPFCRRLQVCLIHGAHPSSLLWALGVGRSQDISLAVLFSNRCAHGNHPGSILNWHNASAHP